MPEDITVHVDVSRGVDHTVFVIRERIAREIREAGRREGRAVEQMRQMRIGQKAAERRVLLASMRRKKG